MSNPTYPRNLGLSSVAPFGKHKGKIIEDVYRADRGYLVWLRNERYKVNNQKDFFDTETNTLLDMTIQQDKGLRAKFQTFQALGLLNMADPVTTNHEPEDNPEAALEYGAWGAF